MRLGKRCFQKIKAEMPEKPFDPCEVCVFSEGWQGIIRLEGDFLPGTIIELTDDPMTAGYPGTLREILEQRRAECWEELIEIQQALKVMDRMDRRQKIKDKQAVDSNSRKMSV